MEVGGSAGVEAQDRNQHDADDQADHERGDHPEVSTGAVIVVGVVPVGVVIIVIVGSVVTSSHAASFAHPVVPAPPDEGPAPAAQRGGVAPGRM